MSNSFLLKDTQYKVGDTIEINYKIKEGEKERIQIFKGILLKIRGNSQAERMITLRKITKSGIGVERVIPLSSPYITSMKLVKKSSYNKAKLYFVRNLSEQEIRTKLYQVKQKVVSKKKKAPTKKNESISK
jgi:large subunit ribosomal protein L19